MVYRGKESAQATGKQHLQQRGVCEAAQRAEYYANREIPVSILIFAQNLGIAYGVFPYHRSQITLLSQACQDIMQALWLSLRAKP